MFVAAAAPTLGAATAVAFGAATADAFGTAVAVAFGGAIAVAVAFGTAVAVAVAFGAATAVAVAFGAATAVAVAFGARRRCPGNSRNASWRRMRAGGATVGLAMTDATAGVAADDAAGAAGSFGTNALPSQRSSGSLIGLCAALSVARVRSPADADRELETPSSTKSLRR